ARLLWAAYPVLRTAPEQVLSALEMSSVVRWAEPCTASGLALSMLGDLGLDFSARVLPLLPASLQSFPPFAQALLSEALAYAWWCCVEASGDVVLDKLAEFARPVLVEVPGEFQVFALRGAAVAEIAHTMAGRLPVREIAGRQIAYPNWGRGVPF